MGVPVGVAAGDTGCGPHPMTRIAMTMAADAATERPMILFIDRIPNSALVSSKQLKDRGEGFDGLDGGWRGKQLDLRKAAFAEGPDGVGDLF